MMAIQCAGTLVSGLRAADRILVTGATGYIGGSLAPHLIKAGYPLRVRVLNPDRLKGKWWADRDEVAVGDALKPEILAPVLEGKAFE